jgi:hypothetical protein
MSWVRLDDRFFCHRKILSVGLAARWLFVSGLCVAAQHNTDGILDSAAQQLLQVAAAGHDFAALARELVSVGLWEVRPNSGFAIHDYLEYQLSADEQRKERAATAKRQADYRERRRNALRNAASNGVSNGVENATPSRPVPSRPDFSEENDRGRIPPHVQKQAHVDLAGDASHPPPSPRVVAPDLRHEAGERMTPPARIQEAPTAAQGSLLPAEDAPTAKPARRPKSPKALSTTAIAWQAYAEAYEAKYKTAPEKNGQVLGQLARLVAYVGGKAPDLCRYYLTRTDARYRYHPVGMMLSDYQGLLTAMTTGRVITETTARERERVASSPMWQYVADQMDKDRGDVVDVESKPE